MIYQSHIELQANLLKSADNAADLRQDLLNDPNAMYYEKAIAKLEQTITLLERTRKEIANIYCK